MGNNVDENIDPNANEPKRLDELKSTIFSESVEFLYKENYLRWMDLKRIPDRYKKLTVKEMDEETYKKYDGATGLYTSEKYIKEKDKIPGDLINIKGVRTDEKRYVLHTATHEYMHFFSNNHRKLGRYLNEGVTEYLAREIAKERSIKNGTDFTIPGGYDENTDLVGFLIDMYGEEIIKDYFSDTADTLISVEYDRALQHARENRGTEYNYGDFVKNLEDREENYENPFNKYNPRESHRKLLADITGIYINNVRTRALRGDFCGINKDGDVTISNLASMFKPIVKLKENVLSIDEIMQLFEKGVKEIIDQNLLIEVPEEKRAEKIDEIYSEIKGQINDGDKSLDDILLERPSLIDDKKHDRKEVASHLMNRYVNFSRRDWSSVAFLRNADRICSSLGISIKDIEEDLVEYSSENTELQPEQIRTLIDSGNKLDIILQLKECEERYTERTKVYRVSPNTYFCTLSEVKMIVTEGKDGQYKLLQLNPEKAENSNDDITVRNNGHRVNSKNVEYDDYFITPKGEDGYFLRMKTNKTQFETFSTIETPSRTPFSLEPMDLTKWAGLEAKQSEIEAFKAIVESGEFNSANSDNGKIDLEGFRKSYRQLWLKDNSILQEGLKILLDKEYGPYNDLNGLADDGYFLKKKEAYVDIATYLEDYAMLYDRNRNKDISESLDLLETTKRKQAAYYSGIQPKTKVEEKPKESEESKINLLKNIVDLSGKLPPSTFGEVTEEISNNLSKKNKEQITQKSLSTGDQEK